MVGEHATDVPPFVLYLRPFGLTGTVPLRNPSNRLGLPLPISADAMDVEVDFEIAIERQLCKKAPVVALGNASRETGPGLIQTDDEDWQDRFQHLARAATLITVIPTYGEGTLWEMRWLREHSELSKLIGICPPKLLKHQQWFEGQWAKAREELASYDVALPAFEHGGFLVEWQDTGQIARCEKLGSARKSIWRLVRSRLDQDAQDYRGLKTLRRKIRFTAVYTCLMTVIAWVL